MNDRLHGTESVASDLSDRVVEWIKDRLGNVERIVTDGSHTLDREIESLRIKPN